MNADSVFYPTNERWADLISWAYWISTLWWLLGNDFVAEIQGQNIYQGDTSTGWILPVAPTNEHTLINVARYYPSNGNNKGYILSVIYHNQEASFGFKSGLTGVASYMNGWITPASSSQFDHESWLISSQRNDLYRGNMQDFTTNSIEFTRLPQLFMGGSDFQFAELFAFNQRLNITEIECYENYLYDKYKNNFITCDEGNNARSGRMKSDGSEDKMKYIATYQ